jgi:hypothetical protein
MCNVALVNLAVRDITLVYPIADGSASVMSPKLNKQHLLFDAEQIEHCRKSDQLLE